MTVGGNWQLPADLPVRRGSYDRSYQLRKENDTMRFHPTSDSRSTGSRAVYSSAAVDPAAELAEKQRHSAEALALFEENSYLMAERSGERTDRLLSCADRIFTTPVIYDEALGTHRAVTLPELMSPGLGPLIIMQIKKALVNDIGVPIQTVNDYLRTVRVVLRFFETHTMLPSGVDLVKRWGPMCCPLQDRDVPKYKPTRPPADLPKPDQVLRIIEASLAWALAHNRAYCPLRTTVMMAIGFDAGLRGIELRNMLIEDMPGLRTSGDLYLRDTKNGENRGPKITDDARALLCWWCDEWRSKTGVPACRGPVFPSEQGDLVPITDSAYSQGLRRWIEEMQRQGLLRPGFRGHDVRKTYATNAANAGMDLWDLMKQCGWRDPAQAAVYVRLRGDHVSAQQAGFARTLNMRHAA